MPTRKENGMHLCRCISTIGKRELFLGFCSAGFLLTGCTPEEVQAPRVEIEAAVVPTSGLIGEWKLDETSGTTAVDSKNGYNATVLGGAAFIAGKIGNALNLNNGTAGTGAKSAQMPSNATLDNVQEGNYTISAWFFPYTIPPDATADNRHWAIVAKASPHMGILYNANGKFLARHYLTGTVGEQAAGATVYPAGSWYHLASTVSRTAGTVKIYVNGVFQDQAGFAPNTAAEEYGTTPFQIGKSGTFWAANGMVDQVRIYNRELTATEIADLFNETVASFRFPVGMGKGTDTTLLGDSPTPDGHMTTGTAAGLIRTLDAARNANARVTIRVTGGNANFQTNGDRIFVLSKWKAAFDNVSGEDMSGYLADGTFIGHYAIDEPFADFDNMTSAFLEQMCQYQKSFAGWSSVPCIIRDRNTRLHEKAPAGGYQYLDAGWGSIADHAYANAATYNGDMGAYFRDNLAKGRLVGLGLMYGFNLINGGVEFEGCAKPDDPNSHNCAMTAAEIRAMADTLAAIGNDQGCGVIGYRINSSPSLERDYFFGTGIYEGNGIQSALQYLNSRVGGLRPGSCGP